MKYLAFFLSSVTALAAVEGTVMNRTTGKPQGGAAVVLLKLTQAGPQMVTTVRASADGTFRIDQALGPEPHLIETAWQSVTYNRMLPPGSPTTGIQVDVYDSTDEPGSAQVAQHIVLLEPAAQQLSVSEAYMFNNTGTRTYNDPRNGTLRFQVPQAGQSSLRVMATAPRGMPVQRSATKATRGDVYRLDFPIKPGQTRIDVSYMLPLSPPATFSGKTFYKGGPTRLVAPNGVTLEGEGLKLLGNEPATQAAIYEVQGNSYEVKIQGTGSMRAAQEAGDESGPAIQQILPRIYDRVVVVVVAAFLALALGFILLYRKGGVALAKPEPARGKPRG